MDRAHKRLFTNSVNKWDLFIFIKYILIRYERWGALSSTQPTTLGTTTTPSTTSTAGTSLKETTGMVMVSTKLKSEMNPIILLKLLDGTWNKEDSKKISKPEKFVQDFSTLLVVSQWVGDHTELSLALLLLNSRVLTNSSLLLSKILSMITFTAVIKATSKKVTIQFTQLPN